MLQDRGALPKEEGDVIREYKAIHEENFLDSWLREDVEGKEEGKKKVDKDTKEEVSRKREREGEKGKDQTVVVKRRCINLVSAEAFDIFSQGENRGVVGILGVFFWVNIVDCLTVVL